MNPGWLLARNFNAASVPWVRSKNASSVPCYHYLITLFLPFHSAIVGPEVSLYLIKGLTSKIKVKTFSSLFHPGGAAVVSCDHFRRHLQLPGRQLGVLRSGPLLGRDDVIGRLPGVRNPAQSAPAESAQRFQARAHICVVRTRACVSVELQIFTSNFPVCLIRCQGKLRALKISTVR